MPSSGYCPVRSRYVPPTIQSQLTQLKSVRFTVVLLSWSGEVSCPCHSRSDFYSGQVISYLHLWSNWDSRCRKGELQSKSGSFVRHLTLVWQRIYFRFSWIPACLLGLPASPCKWLGIYLLWHSVCGLVPLKVRRMNAHLTYVVRCVAKSSCFLRCTVVGVDTAVLRG